MVEPGTRLGPYEVVAEVGRGGMATLYLGKYEGPGGFRRNVAIKAIHPEIARDPDVVKMFLDEARLSACIHHPNVVHVEALLADHETHYIVMEYIEGVTLADVLRGQIARGEPMPIAIAVHIAAQIAAGLHAAHESKDEAGQPLGIIHRDVSPQNILIDLRGHVKLIDFGIAKARYRLVKTTLGSVKGKLAYISPEQLGGLEVDRRLDVWALGVVLWEMLLMRRLFHRSNDLDTMLAVKTFAVPAPTQHRLEIPPRLDDVILTMLARALDERFSTAAACRAAMLTAVPSGAAVDAETLAAFVQAAAGDVIAQRARRRIEAGAMDDATSHS